MHPHVVHHNFLKGYSVLLLDSNGLSQVVAPSYNVIDNCLFSNKLIKIKTKFFLVGVLVNIHDKMNLL